VTARDLTAFLADLAGFNDGQRRARAAYARVMADLEPNPTTAEDEAEQRRLSHVLANRRYRARKAER